MVHPLEKNISVSLSVTFHNKGKENELQGLLKQLIYWF
jgi:hypothetical protein